MTEAVKVALDKELVDFANMFLITNGLFFTALGATATHNDKLKTCLSLAGILISLMWCICTFEIFGEKEIDTLRGQILVFMPMLFMLGWFFSLGVHACHWRKGQIHSSQGHNEN